MISKIKSLNSRLTKSYNRVIRVHTLKYYIRLYSSFSNLHYYMVPKPKYGVPWDTFEMEKKYLAIKWAMYSMFNWWQKNGSVYWDNVLRPTFCTRRLFFCIGLLFGIHFSSLIVIHTHSKCLQTNNWWTKIGETHRPCYARPVPWYLRQLLLAVKNFLQPSMFCHLAVLI